MEQIKVEVYVAALGMTVEFLLPTRVKLCNLMRDIQLQLETMYALQANSCPVLIDKAHGAVLNPDADLEKQGVQNGELLILC